MTKITEEKYNEFPSLRGKEGIFEEATKIIVEGWAEAKRQMSQPQQQLQKKQERVETQQESTTSLPTT
jgi:hypothetical protein